MKASVLDASLALMVMASLAEAQDGLVRGFLGQARGVGQGTSAPADPPKTDQRVFPATAALPAPTPPDQLKPATIELPNDPIEPWLLTDKVGPFMVTARTFRGPDAGAVRPLRWPRSFATTTAFPRSSSGPRTSPTGA